MEKINPLLYQINTRVWLNALSKRLGKPVTLASVPEDEIDRIAAQGFNWVWLLSVWKTGVAGRTVSRNNAIWRNEFEDILPDLKEEDICGSGFAITEYSVSESLGGDSALENLRKQLSDRNVKLMLDFVPNHTALDHIWKNKHPDYFITGTNENLEREPYNYIHVETTHGSSIFAHGRDPFFQGWPDTLQLNYGNKELCKIRIQELLRIAAQCDGVRCDMAMLLEPEIFLRTWGVRIEPFWPTAIQQVRHVYPGFSFMAEVYWDMEWSLQQQGFDYCYDKRFYDRICEGNPGSISQHLNAGLDYQNKLVRFLENHDEPRAAKIFFHDKHKAAAVVTFFTPGLRFFHQGQLEGRHKRISPHLCRGPEESVDYEIQTFYDQLLKILKHPLFHEGSWVKLDPIPVETDSLTFDHFIAYLWQKDGELPNLVVVNFSETFGKCYVPLQFKWLQGQQVRLMDRFGMNVSQHTGDSLFHPGFLFEAEPWQYCVIIIEII